VLWLPSPDSACIQTGASLTELVFFVRIHSPENSTWWYESCGMFGQVPQETGSEKSDRDKMADNGFAYTFSPLYSQIYKETNVIFHQKKLVESGFSSVENLFI
jgi:hypothetical protein